MGKNNGNQNLQDLTTTNTTVTNLDPTQSPTVAPEQPQANNVNQEDYNGDTVTSKINDSDDTIQFQSNGNIALDGNVDPEFETLVNDTIRGVYGSGRDRMNALGDNYAKVQAEITRRIRLRQQR